MQASRLYELRELATDCVITRTELHDAGIAAGTVVRHCSPGGPWQRILPGIILLHNGIATQRQRLVSALKYAGSEAIVSGHAALNLHGLSSTVNDTILILLPQECARLSTSFVIIERTWRHPEPVLQGGIPCAPIPRATLDAARRLRGSDPCRALLTNVVQRRLSTVDSLAAELSMGSIRGSALPRATLREMSTDAHSVAELAAQKLYRRARLPDMVHNQDVLDDRGDFLCRPDGWIDNIALAWEIDSLAHHLAPSDHERTLLRRARMEAAGIVVVTHLPKQITESPAVVIAQLRAAIAIAGARTRPRVALRQD